MANFTYRITTNEVCKYPGIAYPSKNLKPPTYLNSYPAFKTTIRNSTDLVGFTILNFRQPNESLGFITCADMGRAKYDFASLGSVFSLNLWLLIVITSSASHIFLLFTATKKSFGTFELFQQMVKVLLEQGTPYTRATLISNSRRVVIYIFLLSGIVLSNLYKNVNVYKMTVPIPRLPFKTFEQLVDNQVTGFTRCVSPRYLVNWKKCNQTFQIINQKWLSVVYNHNISTGIDDTLNVKCISEVSKLTGVSGQNYGLNKVLNTLRLPPQIAQIVRSSIVGNGLSESCNTLYFRLRRSFQTRFRQTERLELLNDLANCNKTALILPHNELNDYKQTLSKHPYNKLADIGKERYSPFWHSVSLTGVISSNTWLRVRVTEQSGITNWWENLLETFGNRGSSRSQHLVPVALSGNIFVIIALLLIGHSIAVSTFIIELTLIQAIIRLNTF